MRRSIIRYAVVGVLLLGLAIPGITLADGAGKGCSLQGSWFGVIGPDDTRLTGWMVTTTGKSNNQGTNNLEYPNYDPTLGGFFPNAVRISTMRGAWERTGGNTFDYTFTGIALDQLGTPEYIAKVSGHITLSANCRSEYITATLEVFLPFMSPFDDPPFHTEILADHWGYRAHVDLP